jgi:hypothetical protein
MIAELITPLLLATAPMTITMEQLKYSHETQQAQSQDIQVAQYRPTTWNATRTYAPNGQPSDSDND